MARRDGAAAAVACSLVLVALMGGVVKADESGEVRDWLDRMNHALSNLDYQGTFVYQHDNQLDSIRIVHIANERGEHERLTSLNGAPREVIRTENTVRCILPDDNSIVVNRRLTTSLFPTMPASQVADLERHYRFKLGPRDRIAGLETQVIGVMPRDPYRYGYRLWLESDTGMLLKSELLDHDGNSLEQVMFTEISLGDRIPLSALKTQFGDAGLDFGPMPPTPAEVAEEGDEPESATPDRTAQLKWTTTGLPPGFHLKSHDWESLSEQARPAEHMVFSDGLASVSVYVEKPHSPGAGARDGASRMGAVNAFTRQFQDYRITVVGEVPPVTVRNIAARVRQRAVPVAAND